MEKTLIIISIFITFLSFSQIDITKDLMVYYPFDGNTNDSSGNEYHGLLDGPIVSMDRFSRNDKAYFFDGLDDCIDLPDDARLKPATNYTMVYWLKADQTTRYDIVTQRSGDYVADSFNFGIIMNLPEMGKLQYNFPQYNNDNTTLRNVSYNNYNDGLWHMWVFNKDLDGKTMEIYVDTNLIASKSIIDLTFQIKGTLRIGKNYLGNRPFNGNMDDFRIYQRILNKSEIDYLFGLTPSSIGSSVPESSIQIFPTRTNDLINITNPNNDMIKVLVYDLNGKIVLKGNNIETLSLLDLLPSVYIVRIESETYTVTHKIMKY